MTVFLDTSGLIALADRSDQWHDQAVRLWSDLAGANVSLLTTSLVLAECGDGLSRVNRRQDAIRLRRQALDSDRIAVLYVTQEIEDRAWELFEQRPDKEWGVTDCVSFLVMQDRGMTDAFTADRHFTQAGFCALLPAN